MPKPSITPTPPEAYTYWLRTGKCISCFHNIRYKIHLHNHWLKWHKEKPKQTYFKLYTLRDGKWVFQRNFTNKLDCATARWSLRNKGYCTAVEIVTKEL